ncbi:MAG: hypothetical protein ACTHLH_09950 [Solirubrobacterales bacterium]
MSGFNPYLNGLGEMNLSDLVRLVHAGHEETETLALEWKREWPLDNRPRRAGLARHIIGFSNRDPDQAARTYKGYGLILIGVEPGIWGQAPDVDPAVLVQQLDPFTGSELGWQPSYLSVDGNRVLAIVVEPPRWGDPTFSMQRGSSDPENGAEIAAGAVFVRRPGLTVPADQDELERLARRAEVPRPHLSAWLDWNLGESGEYVGVKVINGGEGRGAVLREVGLAMPGTVELAKLVADASGSGIPADTRAYLSLPITREDASIAPGQMRSFRRPLGRLPFLWDERTPVFPYAYFDDGRWLVGEPALLVENLKRCGWREPTDAPPTFAALSATCVAPEAVAGLRAELDLSL